VMGEGDFSEPVRAARRAACDQGASSRSAPQRPGALR
jgi:hypothetical protein